MQQSLFTEIDVIPEKRRVYPFVDQDGRQLRKSEVNFHHAIWERKNYTSKREKLFRSLSGLVLPIMITWHDDLHANLRPPKKVGRILMDAAIDFNEGIDVPDVYDQFEVMTGFFVETAETSPNIGMAEDAHKLAANLILQKPFIDRGRVFQSGVGYEVEDFNL